MRPLRVLMVTQSYHPVCGGIGEHVRNLALALETRGHTVRVLTSGPPPAGGELPGLGVLRIGRRFRFRSNGARANLAFHPMYRDAVRGALGEGGYDLVHVHSPLEPFLPWAVILESKVPCVGTFHNAGPIHWGYRFFAGALATLVGRLRLRTAVSRSAAHFAGRFFPGEFLVIPNGVDLDRFSPDGPRPSGRSAPTILFVGSLEPRKGLDVLLDAVPLVRDRLGAAPEVMIVGDGSLRRSIQRKAMRRGIDLRLLGSVPYDEIARCYRGADFLVAPALYGESFGIVLLEALASGIPVIASSIEGYAEVLADCPSARLVRPNHPESLAAGIAEMWRTYDDVDHRVQSRRHAAVFGWAGIAAQAEAAYLEALEGSPADGPRIRVPGGFGDITPDLTFRGAELRSRRSWPATNGRSRRT
jgi:phosphatidylinositol alpha-mannosyltransferase